MSARPALTVTESLSPRYRHHPVGGVTALINSWLTGDEEVYCIVDSSCRVVLVDEERAAVLQPHLKELRGKGVAHVVIARGNKEMDGMVSLEALLQNVSMFVDVPAVPTIEAEDEAIIMYSSGQ